MPAITRGARVAYSARFLRSTGQQAGTAGCMRGTVEEVEPFGGDILVTVRWDNWGIGRVLAPNLTPESRIGIDAALADRS